jgi:hypothetical protein
MAIETRRETWADLAATARHETRLLQRADRFANGGAMDAELVGQRRFRRQRFADLYVACEDLGFDRARHRTVGRLRDDRGEKVCSGLQA